MAAEELGMKRVVLAFGTRPEAIKMAPVYRALARTPGLLPLVLLTGQHREQLEDALSLFNLPVARDLRVMRPRQALTDLAGRLVPRAAEALRELSPDYVLVHGDTLTTFAVAWAAFLNRTPVGHVEAGLRSHHLGEPFPEEANRRLTDVLADLLLAPTPEARTNLLREGRNTQEVVVTGQTGIDAIVEAARRGRLPPDFPPGPYVTVTLHRRENWPKLGQLAGAVRRLALDFPELTFVFPLHRNPAVREAVMPVLAGLANLHLTNALPYGPMAALLGASRLILTDSGGLQEEGAALRVPVAVVRNRTERPEGIQSGHLFLVGTDPEEVYRRVRTLLTEGPRRTPPGNPFGDGHASVRVAQAVAWRLGLAPRPTDWSPPTPG